MEQTPTPTPTSVEEQPPHDEIARLSARVAELEHEREHLVALVDIVQDVSTSGHFVDVLQAIARRLGSAFGLDRCAVFLSGDKDEVRLVASYEDPAIRNLVVDLNRYPELKKAFDSGETVFIPDAANDPMLRSIKGELDTRNVRSIIVVPIRWEGSVIGAIFLRTERDAEPFGEADVHFCQQVASITARALHNAHRVESLISRQQDISIAQRKADLQRIALLSFLRRLLERTERPENDFTGEHQLPNAAGEELDRLVTVAMQVLDEEAKG
jgi:GAF domain-containing protein